MIAIRGRSEKAKRDEADVMFTNLTIKIACILKLVCVMVMAAGF